MACWTTPNYFFQASKVPFGLAHQLHHPLSYTLHPGPIQDPPGEGLSSGPKEGSRGCLPADLELWHRNVIFVHTMLMKQKQAYIIPLK